MPFTLTRAVIDVNPVQHALLLREGVGYVDLTVFSSSAGAELTKAIDSLRTAGARALVLDLRGDPGGLLDQGIAVADLFLDPGQKIVSTRGRTADETRTFTDAAAQKFAAMPLIVLTDSGTASASEIVAGALQDHDRALIVGTTTYGKGSAQRVFHLDEGALKLTTALWFTPNGRSINRPRPSSTLADADVVAPDSITSRPRYSTDAGRTVLGGGGIVPDVEVADVATTKADRALQAAVGAKVSQFRDATAEYAVALKAAGTLGGPDFTVTPAMRDELYRRLRRRGVVLPRGVYDSAATLVTRVLAAQVARYAFGTRAQFARTLRDDPAIARALTLLDGAPSQQALFARAARSAAP